MLVLGPVITIAQEEESAELFTESYTDRFQEVFFEALKQKGIENYDRARDLLLEAKKLDPLHPVIDHELARILYLEKQYDEAEVYALEALKAEPGEFWFLETFMQILEAQSKIIDGYLPVLPEESPAFRLNLASWYLQVEKWDDAKEELIGLPESQEVRQLSSEIARKEALAAAAVAEAEGNQPEPVSEEGTVTFYQKEIGTLIDGENWPQLETVSGEALDFFPLQPFFYYANGLSLLKQGQAEKAVQVLESGEAMLLEDSQVSGLIYRTLAEAHGILGDTEKAKKYLDKLKPGS